MKRRYQKELYEKKINEIKTNIDNVCIGADVIVGFPGETEEEFNKTVAFIKNLPISYLHVFPYSERENTEAIKFEHIFCDSNNDETKNAETQQKMLVIYYQIPQHKQIWCIGSK